MRTPVALFILALAVRLGLIALFADAAYPDSYYYADVARALAAGHGFNIDVVWIFAEVGNRIPDVPTLPIPSNAHWLPLSSLIQAPFITILGPTAFASALPMALIGSLAAPLTWAIARDARAQPIVAGTAGVLSAIPGAVTVFMVQPENFAIVHPLVAATLWCTARGLKGSKRAFAVAGLLAGLVALARNDGVLLGGTIGLVWLLDRVRWWRGRRGSGSWVHVEDRRPIPVIAGLAALGLFLLFVGPWWVRQIAVFGSISPTSSNGAALWIRDIAEWNSITAKPSLATFLAQGPGSIVASRLAGLGAALQIFTVLVSSVVLLPFLIVGVVARIRSRDFGPWFLYSFVVFAAATLLYPVHVAGGTFIHTAIGLAPHAAILSMEGVLIVVGWIASRRRTWEPRSAGAVFAWGIVALVVSMAVVFGRPVQVRWEESRAARVAVGAELDRRLVPRDERILSIDAAGFKYWTGHPGVVTPDDPIETIEAVARAYEVRWLVIERDDAARSLAPILLGTQTVPWIGRSIFAVRDDSGLRSPSSTDIRLALYPVCTTPDDRRCDAGQ